MIFLSSGPGFFVQHCAACHLPTIGWGLLCGLPVWPQAGSSVSPSINKGIRQLSSFPSLLAHEGCPGGFQPQQKHLGDPGKPVLAPCQPSTRTQVFSPEQRLPISVAMWSWWSGDTGGNRKQIWILGEEGIGVSPATLSLFRTACCVPVFMVFGAVLLFILNFGVCSFSFELVGKATKLLKLGKNVVSPCCDYFCQ